MTFFKKIHKRKRLLFILPILLIVPAILFTPKQAETIETQTIKNGNVTESLTATGTIDATNSVNLNFLSGGKLVYLGAHKGDFVEAGQIIAILDQRTIQKNLETALKNYSLQRNTFDQTKDDQNDHTPQNALNDEMKRILEDNQNNLDKAIISVDLQQLAKEQSIITTPIGGILIKADVSNTGLNVTPTTTFTVADPSTMVFKMDIDEADIGRIKQDQTVKVTLDAYPDQTLTLSVNAIDFATHPTTTGGNAYTVESALPSNENIGYRLGMNGDAEIVIHEKKDVPTLSLASIFDDKYVYVKKDTSFEKREVTFGISSETDVEILSGLVVGDEVALNPDDAEKKMKKKRFLFF
jgi:RND family efflux transporter MFP subunit